MITIKRVGNYRGFTTMVQVTLILLDITIAKLLPKPLGTHEFKKILVWWLKMKVRYHFRVVLPDCMNNYDNHGAQQGKFKASTRAINGDTECSSS